MARTHGGDLARALIDLDGSGYGRYKSLTGEWQLDGATLEVRRVQADPYAPPSRLRVTVPAATAGFPDELHDTPVRRRALGSYLLRALRRALQGSPLTVDAGGQEVIERSAVHLDQGDVHVELGVPLPGRGRRIAGKQAAQVLTETLPQAARDTLRWDTADQEAARRFVATVEDSDALRKQLAGQRLVAFVPDGSVLPRRSGVDDRVMPDAVPFSSPESLRTTLTAPNTGEVTGMGIPEGVTLIVGGGYHGKSTLLRAVEAGVYDHVPGDGRDLVVARPDAVKVRAEDERSVERVDLRAFVTELPGGRSTEAFSTASASGSTSQAASTLEALESGTDALLIDEDTSATNVMIRDSRMQQLISPEREPLVPFVERVRPLHERHGVSTVLVMGGSGDYLEVADTVIMMDAYSASEVTDRAHEIAAAAADTRAVENAGFPGIGQRVFDPGSIDPTVKGKRKVTARGRDRLSFGETDIDLGAIEQITDPSQVTGIGLALAHVVRAGLLDGSRSVGAVLDALESDLDAGLDRVAHGYTGDYARPRRHEVVAALNRLRTARVRGG